MKIIPAASEFIHDLTITLRESGEASLGGWCAHCAKETAADDQGQTLVAFVGGDGNGDQPVGFISLLYTASYPAFRRENIAEIDGLGVLPAYRGQGVAKALLSAIEDFAIARKIGLGAGVTRDYQTALRLYLKSGYLPDGRGLYHAGLANEFADYGDMVVVDGSTTLWFVKDLEEIR